jgi:hypothetical protein
MNYLYKFTPDELRVVLAAHQRYQQVLGIVAELHGFRGDLTVAGDLSGFLAPDQAPAPPQHVNGGLAPEEHK